MGWELKDVEQPFVEQLLGLGWQYIEGSLDEPALTGRTNFTEVIQEGVLRQKLRAINLREVDGPGRSACPGWMMSDFRRRWQRSRASRDPSSSRPTRRRLNCCCWG